MVLRNTPARAAGLLSAVCLLISVPAMASQSLLAVMRSCAAEADASARLQCYDREMAQFKGADVLRGADPACSDTGVSQPVVSSKPGQPVTSKSAATTQPSPAPSATIDQFGLTSGQVLRKSSNDGRSPPLKKITARISALAHKPGGALVVHLDNGQVWEQTEEGPDLHIAAGDAVAIDRGVLGAFWLSRVPGHVVVKVQRTQ